MQWMKLSCSLLLLFTIVGTRIGSGNSEENAMEVKDFPQELVFFTEDARKTLPKETVAYYNWPTEEELGKKLITEGEAVSNAKTSSVGWIKKVLQDKWIPKDIENRLIALNDEAKGHDQTRARYMIDKYAIQIIQNTSMISILVQEVEKTPLKETAERAQLVKDTVRTFLNEYEKICSISCSDLTGTKSRYGLLEGRPVNTEIKDSGIYWWGHMHWTTDGQSVMLTILKFDGGPAEPSRAENWF